MRGETLTRYPSYSMARKGETHLQKRVHSALRRNFKWWGFKVHGGPFQAAGIPDIVGCCAGLFFGIEVKMPKGKISDIQKETICDIKRKGGAFATVVTTPEEAVEFVRRVLRKEDRLLEGAKAPAKRGRGLDRRSTRERTDLQAALRKDLHRLRRS